MTTATFCHYARTDEERLAIWSVAVAETRGLLNHWVK